MKIKVKLEIAVTHKAEQTKNTQITKRQYKTDRERENQNSTEREEGKEASK